MRTTQAFPSLFLAINSVTWFSLTWFVIRDFVQNASFNEILSVGLAFYGAFILSAFVGATVLSRKLRSRLFLLVWVALGVGTCLLSSFLIRGMKPYELDPVAFALGAFVGLGVPSCLANFADSSSIDNRGRLGAVIFFMIQSLTVLIYIPINGSSIFEKFLILAAWRTFGLIGAVLFEPQPREQTTERKKINSLPSILMDESFAFYFIPWFLFAIIEFIESPLLERFFGPELFNSYSMIGIVVVGFAALIGGILCDLKGRKVTSIMGFVALGTGYAVLSLFSGAWLAQILYTILDGLAWGLLYVTLVFVVWGDLSEGRVRERYYLLGGMPFLLSGLIEILVKPLVRVIPVSTSFSLASLFLFLAILPLLYAPETLPEKKLKERELRGYIEKAKKTKEKYT